MIPSSNHIRLIFGLKLHQLRLDNELSLTKLSNETGISKSYLNEIEKGKKYPRPEKIYKLAKTLNTSYDDLVSLQLHKNLAPISQLIQSNVLDALPLDFFGMDQSDILRFLSVAPVKLSAFVDSILQIASSYAIRVEHFYFAVMRSYQEMHDNYFPEIEVAARTFREKYKIMPGSSDSRHQLDQYLVNECNYQIKSSGLNLYPNLQSLRYVRFPEKKRTKLLLNGQINRNQQLLILARETGYNYLGLRDRSMTASWVESSSFDHVMNNFKAYYFAGAILLPEKIFLRGLINFMENKRFDEQDFKKMIIDSKVTPELFFLRITNLVPKYLKYYNLFFFRYNYKVAEEQFSQTKELYGSGLQKGHGVDLEIKPCQRYAAIHSLLKFENRNLQTDSTDSLITIYKIRYENSSKEFLIIGIAQDMKPTLDMNCYIGIGFEINPQFKEKTKFLSDKNIESVLVNFDWIKESSSEVSDGLESISAIERDSSLKNLREEISIAVSQEKRRN